MLPAPDDCMAAPVATYATMPLLEQTYQLVTLRRRGKLAPRIRRIGSLDAERRQHDFVTAHMLVGTTRSQHIMDQDARPRIDAISTPHERRDDMALIAGAGAPSVFRRHPMRRAPTPSYRNATLTYLSIDDTFFQPDTLAIQNPLGEIVTLPVDVLVETFEVLLDTQPGRTAEKISKDKCFFGGSFIRALQQALRPGATRNDGKKFGADVDKSAQQQLTALKFRTKSSHRMKQTSSKPAAGFVRVPQMTSQDRMNFRF